MTARQIKRQCILIVILMTISPILIWGFYSRIWVRNQLSANQSEIMSVFRDEKIRIIQTLLTSSAEKWTRMANQFGATENLALIAAQEPLLKQIFFFDKFYNYTTSMPGSPILEQELSGPMRMELQSMATIDEWTFREVEWNLESSRLLIFHQLPNESYVLLQIDYRELYKLLHISPLDKNPFPGTEQTSSTYLPPESVSALPDTQSPSKNPNSEPNPTTPVSEYPSPAYSPDTSEPPTPETSETSPESSKIYSTLLNSRYQTLEQATDYAERKVRLGALNNRILDGYNETRIIEGKIHSYGTIKLPGENLYVDFYSQDAIFASGNFVRFLGIFVFGLIITASLVAWSLSRDILRFGDEIAMRRFFYNDQNFLAGMNSKMNAISGRLELIDALSSDLSSLQQDIQSVQSSFKTGKIKTMEPQAPTENPPKPQKPTHRSPRKRKQ